MWLLLWKDEVGFDLNARNPTIAGHPVRLLKICAFILFCLAFVFPALENVKYHRDSKSLTCGLKFPLLDDYCIRLQFNTSDNFQRNYSECDLQSNTEVSLDSVLAGTELRSIDVSLCLKRRLDVCSDSSNAEFGEFLETSYLHNFCV